MKSSFHNVISLAQIVFKGATLKDIILVKELKITSSQEYFFLKMDLNQTSYPYPFLISISTILQ